MDLYLLYFDGFQFYKTFATRLRPAGVGGVMTSLEALDMYFVMRYVSIEILSLIVL